MKYFFGFLVCVGLIVLVFILIMRSFSSGPQKSVQQPLSDYANTSTVMRLTVSGPIIADTQFQSYEITVGRDETSIVTRQGYENNVIQRRTYGNNQEAYTNFLRALDYAGFTKGNTKSTAKDERGACASGDRFVMEIKDGNSQKQRYWTTSCSGLGTFKGNTATVRRLFGNQIPTPELGQMLRGLRV